MTNLESDSESELSEQKNELPPLEVLMEEELPPLENLLEGVLTDELEFLKELGEESLNDEDELPPRKDGDFGSTGV